MDTLPSPAWEALTDKFGRENQIKYYRIAMRLAS
jgi:hypothetical protein